MTCAPIYNNIIYTQKIKRENKKYRLRIITISLELWMVHQPQTLITSLLNAKPQKTKMIGDKKIPKFGKMGRKIEREIC